MLAPPLALALHLHAVRPAEHKHTQQGQTESKSRRDMLMCTPNFPHRMSHTEPHKTTQLLLTRTTGTFIWLDLIELLLEMS